MNIEEIGKYVNTVLPDLRDKICVANDDDIIELYKLYEDVLCMMARYDFGCFNEYLELDEDKTNPNRGFYHNRKECMKEIIYALNDMEIYDTYDTVLLSCPPRVGKSTFGIRFLAWIIGRHPENTQLAISYSDSITTSFYTGVMEIVVSERYGKIFSDAPLVNQNAKREEIWLKVNKRYPSISFVPINGSMTGRAEAGNYLYCDDLVSGIEEAMSPTRLEKLWQTYSVNAKQRKKQGCKEIHIATRWSVHDPMTKLEMINDGNPRFISIKLSCYDENEESAFDFFGGFNTAYYKEQEDGMDEVSFNALYKQEPVEREGILYNKTDLQYYFDLPKERPDTIISVCDSKNLGSDNVSAPIGYVYGELVYIDDVVYNSGLPEVTRPLVASKWLEHKVVRGDIELNNGGNYYAEDLRDLIKEKNGNTSIRVFYSSNNKLTKIITYSDFVKKHFVFKDKSLYKSNSEYGKFMKDVLSFTQTGKNKHDDAPDTLAMLAQLFQDMSGLSVKVIKRSELGI